MIHISSIFYKIRQDSASVDKLRRRQRVSDGVSSAEDIMWQAATTSNWQSGKPASFSVAASRFGKTHRFGSWHGPPNYDPHLHRVIRRPLSNVEATIVVIKGSLGTGFLAMPLAFNLAGYVTTIICWVLLTGIILFCLHMLLENMYEICRREGIPTVSYPKAIKLSVSNGPVFLRAFDTPAVFIADIILIGYHLSVCTIYVMFIATNVKDLIDQYLIHMDSRFLMCLSVIPLTPLALPRRLKTLVPLWALAIFLQLVSWFVLILYTATSLPAFNTDYLFAPLNNYPDGISLILLSFQSVGVILPVEAQMANPKAFLGKKGILVQTHIILISCYMALGLLGFWRFGVEVEDNVALNLPDHEITPQIIRLLLAIAIFCSFPLQAYAIIEAMWHHWISIMVHKEDRRTLEYVVRCLVVLLAAICAVCFVSITFLLLLVASFCLATLGITYPALIDICLRYGDDYGRFKIYLIRDIIILIIGFMLAILCFVTSLTPTVESYRIK